MNNKKLKYELSPEVVEYILQGLNRTQIAGVQGAKDLLQVVEILKNPLNISDMEKEQYEKLKTKFEKK